MRADVQRTHGREFRVRIGINTGMVVVGAIGRDLRMDYTALGDTVNVAARLLNVAQPGQIATSRHTKTLCEGFFVFEDLGDFLVKGKTEPVRAYAVQSAIEGRTRLEVSKERGLTPLIGRAEERRRLAEAFRKATDGLGGVVVIDGDPGVGKSRLLYEFLRGLDGSGHLELETTCASYGRPWRTARSSSCSGDTSISPKSCNRTRSGGALVCGSARSGSRATNRDSYCTISWASRCRRSSCCGCREPGCAIERTRFSEP